MAQALLRAFGGGIAAPSANRFGAVSPTTADHVAADLGDDVDYLLDGGACEVGVESTIVDLSRGRRRAAAPGRVPREAIEAITGPLASADRDAPAAPGHAREPLRAARAGDRGRASTRFRPRSRRAHGPDRGARARAPRSRVARAAGARATRCPMIVAGMARELYAALRDLDAAGVDVVIAALPPAAGLGEAVGDRLLRAAGPRSNES